MAEETNYDIDVLRQKWLQDYPKANIQQKQIIDNIISAIDNREGRLFFIDGPGGIGKTFVENLILAHVRSKNDIVLTVTSSGITSILLDDDRISHSRFKIPLEILQDSMYGIMTQSTLAQLYIR